MDIEKIKWMVEYAEGFEYGYNAYKKWVSYALRHTEVQDLVNWYLYPLLLQRAIEGINKEEIFQIYQADYGLSVYKTIRESKYEHELYEFKKYYSADQAKEAALDYIYKQERNK